jgi:hypothetical protein
MKENFMKQGMHWSLSVVGLVALLTVSALAQDQAEIIRSKLVADAQANFKIAKPLDPLYSFETKVVKGAPYSATAEAETIQILADGNRIRNKTAMVVYRDSEGRTRRETHGKTPGVSALVYINDPVSGVNYTLDVQQRIAVKMGPGIRVQFQKPADQNSKSQTEGFKPPTNITINGQKVRWEELDEESRARIEAKMRASSKMVKPIEKPVSAGGEASSMERTTNTESLGQQMIEGVLCDGKRTTVTIPANSVGNDLPINIVSEEWLSPELQALVLTKHSDPRYGETTYHLTNINRSEPARDLFEVPSDYTLREKPMPLKGKPAKEE